MNGETHSVLKTWALSHLFPRKISQWMHLSAMSAHFFFLGLLTSGCCPPRWHGIMRGLEFPCRGFAWDLKAGLDSSTWGSEEMQGSSSLAWSGMGSFNCQWPAEDSGQVPSGSFLAETTLFLSLSKKGSSYSFYFTFVIEEKSWRIYLAS